MKIVFIRHAEKESQGEDPSLTKRGINQAKVLARRLRKESFDEFYCSNLERSKETSAYVSKLIGLRPKIEDSLNEFSSDVLLNKKSKWDRNLKERYSRLEKFLGSFTKRANQKRNVLIIAHGHTNRLILAILLKVELKNLIRFEQIETAVNEVDWTEKFGNWRLRLWNDVSHQSEKYFKIKS